MAAMPMCTVWHVLKEIDPVTALHLVSRFPSFVSGLGFNRLFLGSVVALGVALSFAAPKAHALDGLKVRAAAASGKTMTVGRETGRPLPRFVSLKSDKVNLRVGPGRKFPISWRYKRAGLPVEIIQEFSLWRRIRDSDGTTGWVLHTLLSGQRTAIVAPWDRKVEPNGVVRASMLLGHRSASSDSSTAARLEAGLQASVNRCTGAWCELAAQGTRFWVKQNKLWGVYPGENVDG